jgi:hypothetical protein
VLASPYLMAANSSSMHRDAPLTQNLRYVMAAKGYPPVIRRRAKALKNMLAAITVLICKWTEQKPSNQRHELGRMDYLKGNMSRKRATTKKISIIHECVALPFQCLRTPARQRG